MMKGLSDGKQNIPDKMAATLQHNIIKRGGEGERIRNNFYTKEYVNMCYYV